MSENSYHQFCPVAKACEVLEPRWTLLIMSELWSGSSRFNEIRRGVPGMSPTLLSKRLKQMETSGLITRHIIGNSNVSDYRPTDISLELKPIVQALGQWAHRNIDSEVTLENLDAQLLMWNIRRKVNTDILPKVKTVIQFTFPELSADKRNYWLINKPGFPVDLCMIDPSFDIDLYIHAELKALTSAWMGWSLLKDEILNKKIVLTGEQKLIENINHWMVISSFAPSQH